MTQSRRNQHQISQRDAANFSFGAKGKVGRTDLDATFGYALTHEFEPDTSETVFLSDHTYRSSYDLTQDPFIPVYSQTDEKNASDVTSL